MPLFQTVLLVYAAAIGTLLALLVLVITVRQITDWWTRRHRPRHEGVQRRAGSHRAA